MNPVVGLFGNRCVKLGLDKNGVLFERRGDNLPNVGQELQETNGNWTSNQNGVFFERREGNPNMGQDFERRENKLRLDQNGVSIEERDGNQILNQDGVLSERRCVNLSLDQNGVLMELPIKTKRQTEDQCIVILFDEETDSCEDVAKKLNVFGCFRIRNRFLCFGTIMRSLKRSNKCSES